MLNLLVQPRFEANFERRVLRGHVTPLVRAVGTTHRIFDRADDIQPNSAVDFVTQTDVVFVTSALRYRQEHMHELERLQRRRLGENVPPPQVVEISNGS